MMRTSSTRPRLPHRHSSMPTLNRSKIFGSVAMQRAQHCAGIRQSGIGKGLNWTGLNFSPVADQIVIDAAQPQRLGIVASEPLDQRLDRIVEIEDQAAAMRISDHALK